MRFLSPLLLALSCALALPSGAAGQEAPRPRWSLEPWATLLLTASEPHRQLVPVFLDVRTGAQVDPAVRALVGGAFQLRLSRHVRVGVRGHYDTDATNNPLARTDALGPLGARGEMDEAYVALEGALGALSVGRRRVAWGPSSHGSLVLSGRGPAPDLVHGRLNLWGHHLESFLAHLSTEAGLTRLLYGHRLIVNVGQDLTLGFSDLSLTAQDEPRLVPWFLIPWIPNVMAEWQSFPGVPDGQWVNSVVGVDVEWRPGPRLFLEWAADDSKLVELQDPRAHRWAWAGGIENETGAWTLGYEYRRVGSWTFTHFSQPTQPRNFRWPVGAPEGPDMDRHITWAHRCAGPWEAWLTGERRRRGEVRLDTLWEPGGEPDDPFPSGIVEGRWILTSGVARRSPSLGRLELLVSYHRITNPNNQAGEENVFAARLAVHLRSAFLGPPGPG